MIRNSRQFRFGFFLLIAWCVMTVTHECGHLVGGWASGGTLREADVRPWSLPYSVFDPDPVPLITLWCGPLLGVIVPTLIAFAVRREWAWFVAYFCWIANGSYLAIAWYTAQPQLDSAKLLAKGAHPATLAVYCVVTIAVGYVGFRRSCQRMLSLSVPV
jgi:hypothetical protein